MSKLLFLAGVAGLALSLAAQSPPPPPTPTESGHEKQQASERVSTNSDLLEQVTVLLKKQNESAERQRQNDRDKSASDWWLVIFTGALTFAGVVQLVAMFKQAGYMRRGLHVSIKAAKSARFSAKAAKNSVNQARENAHLDQRAWIATTASVVRTTTGPFMAEIIIRNTGKTYAKQCFASSQIAVKSVTAADPDFDTLVQKAEKMELGTITPGQNINGPATNIEHVYGQIGKSPPTVVLIFGKVTYRDVFDCDHWITFCYCLRKHRLGLQSVHAEAYGSYNDTDD